MPIRIIKIIAAIAGVLLVSVSCQKSLDPGTTNSPKIANGWWVTFTQGGNDIYGLGTFFLDTYNTSANNNDSMWVDDLGHSWNFKCKVASNYSALTFATPASPNDYNGDSTTVTITGGKVLLKAGTTKGGNKSDSLYMQVKFSDDPSGATYVISGTARTGFDEDDY
jgi:hypothetical protein